MTTRRAFTAALLALAIAAPLPAAAQGGCVADIRQVPAGTQVATLPEAMQRAGIAGQPLDAQLCQSGGGYVYRVRVRDANGEVKSIQIPAS